MEKFVCAQISRWTYNTPVYKLFFFKMNSYFDEYIFELNAETSYRILNGA